MWGKNEQGQLGVGHTGVVTTPQSNPTVKSNRMKFALITGGCVRDRPVGPLLRFCLLSLLSSCRWDHTLAVDAAGSLMSWGSGYESKRPTCGHGSNDMVTIPKVVEAMAGKVGTCCAWLSGLVAACPDSLLWYCACSRQHRMRLGPLVVRHE